MKEPDGSAAAEHVSYYRNPKTGKWRAWVESRYLPGEFATEADAKKAALAALRRKRPAHASTPE